MFPPHACRRGGFSVLFGPCARRCEGGQSCGGASRMARHSRRRWAAAASRRRAATRRKARCTSARLRAVRKSHASAAGRSFAPRRPAARIRSCVRFASCCPCESRTNVHGSTSQTSAARSFAWRRPAIRVCPCVRFASCCPCESSTNVHGSTSQTSAARSRPLAEGCTSPEGSCTSARLRALRSISIPRGIAFRGESPLFAQGLSPPFASLRLPSPPFASLRLLRPEPPIRPRGASSDSDLAALGGSPPPLPSKKMLKNRRNICFLKSSYYFCRTILFYHDGKTQKRSAHAR